MHESPRQKLTAIDVKRTWWYDAFFKAWDFDSLDDLLAAVDGTTIDLAAWAKNRDLRENGLSGWTYWFLFLKGYLEYRALGELDASNTYYRYLTTHFDWGRHDNGLAHVLSDPAQAAERVRWRFRDVDTLATATAEGAAGPEGLDPIRGWMHDPAPPEAKVVYALDSDSPVASLVIDGYHRLFAARLFTVRWFPAELIVPDEDPGSTPDAGALEATRRALQEVLPIPSVERRVLSAGSSAADSFVERGATGVAWLRELLMRHGVQLEELEAILDFGCGAGRFLRHLSRLDGRLYGADCDPYLLCWTSANLRFADCALNGLRPPLEEPEDTFDLVYAVDVFGHWDERLQLVWLEELTRVLKPGGWLVVTLRGASRVDELPHQLAQRFRSGQLVVLLPTLAGTNACASYHPPQYVHEVLGGRLPLIELAPQGATDVRQDIGLFRKPGHVVSAEPPPGS